MIPGPTPPTGGQEGYYEYSTYTNATTPWQFSHYPHPPPQQLESHPQHTHHPHQYYQPTHQQPIQQSTPLPPHYAAPTSTVPIQSAQNHRQPPPHQVSHPRATKRKRVAAQNPAESDNDAETVGNLEEFLAQGGISVGMGGLGIPSGTSGGGVGRLPGACTHCKKLKMKCEFAKHSNTCRRCQTGGHVCIVEGRKPRTAPNKREYLLAQIRQKDAIIESLLKQLHNPYVATPLSIASYKMATSPSDERKGGVIGWLEKLESSLRSDRQFAASPSLPATPTSPQDHANAFTSAGTSSGAEKDNGGSTGTLSFARKHFPSLAPPTTQSGHRSSGDEVDSEEEGGRDGGGDDDDDDEHQDSMLDEHRTALPDSNVPLGLIANLSLGDNTPATGLVGSGGATVSGGSGDKKKVRVEEGKKGKPGEGGVVDPDELDDDNIGVANEGYFQPGPAMDLGKRAMLIEQHSPPEILVHGLVEPKDVDVLFQVFYEKVNPFVGLLDPVLHTPATTFARCPFLFTVVCAVSSRYYPPKSEIYPIAMHFAKHAAANALIDGWKSVELCQAYILMSVYAVPARKWEEDRSWLYTGLAIRIATDLNLHRIPTIKPAGPLPSAHTSTFPASSKASGKVSQREIKEREILNKTRVWMICFNLDRSTATQFGKPFTIRNDFITLGCTEFYTKSPYNDPYDIHLSGYTALLQIVSKFHEEIFSDPLSPGGLNKQIDFQRATLEHDGHLARYHEEWEKRFKEGSDPNDPGCRLRTCLLPFLVSYSRLVMFSFGFQRAFERGMSHEEDRMFFGKCLDSARSVVKVFVELLAPTGYIRYAPDGHFIFSSFASAFLLKLLRPEFSAFISQAESQEIFELIGRLIQTLSSSEIAIDERHTPKLYARFLASLLSKYRRTDHSSQPSTHLSFGQGGPNPGGNGGGPPGPSTDSKGEGQGPGEFGSSGFDGHGFVFGYGGDGGSYGSYGGTGGYGYASTTRSVSPVPPPSGLPSRRPNDGAKENVPAPIYSGNDPSNISAPRTLQHSHQYSSPSSQHSSQHPSPPQLTTFSSPSPKSLAPGPSRRPYGNGAPPTAPIPQPVHTANQSGTFEELLAAENATMVVDPDPTLAAMYALKNPTWWENMMMPGFSWSEPTLVSPVPQTIQSSANPNGAQRSHGMQPPPLVHRQRDNRTDINGFGQPPGYARIFGQHHHHSAPAAAAISM